MQSKIIDVSEHQGVIDWEKVKPHIDGAIIRCGYGDDLKNQDDKQWSRNVRECERLGIPYGVYLYSYATNADMARSEAKHALRLVKGHKLSYPIYFDSEESGTESAAKECAKVFCNAIEDAGYWAGLYSFESFYNAHLRGLTDYTLWIAKFGVNDGKPHAKPEIGATVDMWQYTSTARVSGIAGNVDMSYCYRDFPKEIGGKASTAKAGTAARVLEVAASQIGQENGTKYGKWYESNVDKDADNYDFGASGVAWCAMFVSWVFDKAKAKCAGIPGAYCPSMLAAAKKARKTVLAKNAKPGDVVYFDWDGGVCDHVGIVESNNAKDGYLVTIEGNTDSGIVARKTRYYGAVAGVVRPNYAKANTNNSSKPSTAKKSVDTIAKEVIEGKWGNGDTRKKKLEAAGYDYAKVQAKVNSLLKAKAKKAVKVGASVRIKQGAHQYGTTRTFADFVYKSVYKVVEIRGNRVVFATDKGVVIGAVSKANCIVQ